MSMLDDQFEVAGGNDLFRFGFADDITHSPGGSGSDTVSACVAYMDPVRSDEEGEGVKYQASILVSTSLTVIQSDMWTFDGFRWATETIGKPESSERRIIVVRYEGEYTRPRARTGRNR